MKSMLMCMGGPVMPEVELAGDGQVAGELQVFEVPHAGRPDAGLDEAVVEPGRDAAAQVGADRLVDRSQHLQEHEDDAHDGEGRRQVDRRAAPRPRARPWPRRARRTRCPRRQDGPPGDGQRAVRSGQDREELPLLAVAQRTQHGQVSAGPGRGHPWASAASSCRSSTVDVVHEEHDAFRSSRGRCRRTGPPGAAASGSRASDALACMAASILARVHSGWSRSDPFREPRRILERGCSRG